MADFRTLRNQAGLTQKQAAVMAHCSRRAILKLEQGEDTFGRTWQKGYEMLLREAIAQLQEIKRRREGK